MDWGGGDLWLILLFSEDKNTNGMQMEMKNFSVNKIGMVYELSGSPNIQKGN